MRRLQWADLDTMGRVAAQIVELAARYGGPTAAGIAVSLPFSQTEFAAWVGVSRTGVAHALQSMRQLGWIATQRRRMTVRDLDAVRARAR